MITVTLLGSLLGLAIIDSINPSALLAAGLILAKAPPERKVSAIFWYVAGVYVANLAFGIALLFGLDAFLASFKDVSESRIAYILQAALGGVMLAWGIIFEATDAPHEVHSTLIHLQIFVSSRGGCHVGRTCYGIPLFRAIGMMEQADLTAPLSIAILIFYNIIFVLPPLVLAFVYRFNKERFDAWLRKREANSKPSDAVQWIVAIIGLLLLQDALSALGVFS